MARFCKTPGSCKYDNFIMSSTPAGGASISFGNTFSRFVTTFLPKQSKELHYLRKILMIEAYRLYANEIVSRHVVRKQIILQVHYHLYLVKSMSQHFVSFHTFLLGTISLARFCRASPFTMWSVRKEAFDW